MKKFKSAFLLTLFFLFTIFSFACNKQKSLNENISKKDVDTIASNRIILVNFSSSTTSTFNINNDNSIREIINPKNYKIIYIDTLSNIIVGHNIGSVIDTLKPIKIDNIDSNKYHIKIWVKNGSIGTLEEKGVLAIEIQDPNALK